MLNLTEHNCQEIMHEYYKLAVRAELSDPEADRLEQILQLAEQDSILGFWLNEVDYLVACELNLLDEQHINEYQNQHAKLQEYLDTKINPQPEKLDPVLEHRIKVLSIKLQRQLQYKGYYHGSIDGEVGPRTREALKTFQEHHNLNVHGFLSPNTLDSLGFR